MIRRIDLERFGKFSSSSFALGEVTVFHGPNESGKTTILDSFLYGLCRPSRSKRVGQALVARYGDGLSVTLDSDEPIPRIDSEEFLSILAVSSGDFHVELPEGAGWLDAVKADLFSGGVDPQVVARLLERDSSDARSTTQGKRLAESREALARSKAELQDLGKRRAAILTRETELARSSARLAEIERSLEGSRAELARLTAALKQQELHAQRRRCREVVTLLDEADAAGAAAREIARYADDETRALAALERALGEAEEADRSAAQEAEHFSARVRDAEEAEAKLRERMPAARERAELAARLGAGLGASAGKRSSSGGREVRGTMLGVAAVISLLGSAAALALLDPPLSIAMGAGCAALGGLAIVLAWRTRSGRVAMSRIEVTARDAWLRATGEELGEEVAEGLLRHRMRAEAMEAELVRAAAELERLRSLRRGLEVSSGQASTEARRAGALLVTWLHERGCRSAEEYAAARQRNLNESDRRLRLEARISPFLLEFGVATATELRAECSLRAGNLDRSITAPDADLPARRRMTSRAEELERLVESRNAERSELLRSLAEERGAIRGSLGDVPERIRQTEDEIAGRERETKEIETGMRACAVAAELFGSLARDADAGLRELAAEIDSIYGDIVGGGARRDGERARVRLPRLQLQGAGVPDGGGELRPFPSLSRGTRDSFALAARLALAARAERESRIMVLDEPFLTMDGDRVERACRILDRFRERMRWQIVMLTKDSELLACARRVFGARLVVHELERPARAV